MQKPLHQIAESQTVNKHQNLENKKKIRPYYRLILERNATIVLLAVFVWKTSTKFNAELLLSDKEVGDELKHLSQNWIN